MSGPPLRSFGDFWPFYVRQHVRPGTRVLHFWGLVVFFAATAIGTLAQEWRLVGAGPVLAYAMSWVGHFVVEKNQPATFAHPIWSIVADFRMFGLILIGRMGEEVRRHTSDQLATGPASSDRDRFAA